MMVAFHIIYEVRVFLFRECIQSYVEEKGVYLYLTVCSQRIVPRWRNHTFLLSKAFVKINIFFSSYPPWGFGITIFFWETLTIPFFSRAPDYMKW
jgi:hypothetical protein